jgi:hypothetical protein
MSDTETKKRKREIEIDNNNLINTETSDYKKKSDVLHIPNFFNEEEQIILTKLISKFKPRVEYTSYFLSDVFEKKYNHIINKIVKIIKNKINLIDIDNSNNLKNIINTYDSILSLAYKNNIKEKKNLMFMHYDEWSTYNLTISLGNSIKFTYIDTKNKFKKKEIIINSGDLVFFNGNITKHMIDSYSIEQKKWFNDIVPNVYRYNIQFRKENERYSERILNIKRKKFSENIKYLI